MRKALPKIVQTCLADMDATPDELKAYIVNQMRFYAQLKDTSHSDFTGWIALKLSCSYKEADRVIRWAELNPGVQKMTPANMKSLSRMLR